MKKTILFLVLAMGILLTGAVQAGSVTSSVDATFYGYIKVDAIYLSSKATLDYTAVVPPANMRSYGATTAAAGNGYVKNGDDPAFGITARQTRFGFKLKGPTFGNDGQVLGKIEGDFYGSGYSALTDSYENKGNFGLRIAEIELRTKHWGILAGDEWMIMSPIAPHVANYTAQAELGNLGYRMPQIRFTGYMLDGKLQIQLAADNKMGNPKDAIVYQDIDSGRNSSAPDGQLGIVWDTVANGKPFKLGVTGHYGKEVLGDKYNHGIESWSWNVHYMLPVTKWLSLNGEFYNGANLDTYYCGAQGKGWIRDRNGDFHALQDTGGWGELELGPFKSLQFYGGYTWDDVNTDMLKRATNGGLVAAVSNGLPAWQGVTYNRSYYASAHYWLVPKSTDISFEWMRIDSTYGLAHPRYEPAGTTQTWDDGIANRYTLSFWLFF